MQRRVMVAITVLILSQLLILGACGPAAKEVEKPEDFFRNKTIDVSVGYPGGTAMDLMARLEARYLAQNTGATVVVTPRIGSAGRIHNNYVWNAKPDGLTLGGDISLGQTLQCVVKEEGVQWESDKLSWIVGVGFEPHVFFVAADSPYKSIAGLKAAKGLKFGASAPTSNVGLAAMSVMHLLDLDGKVVCGYKGSKGVVLALNQGEIDGAIYTTSTTYRYQQEGLVKPLFVLASKRLSTFPDVPTITEQVTISKGEKEELFKLWDELFLLSWVLYGPPDIPKDRLAFLQEKAIKWVREPQFVEEATKILGYKPDVFLGGEEITKMVKELLAEGEEVRGTIEMLLARYRA